MATAGVLITLVAAIIALGVVSQILGDRFRVPSIIFLLSVGLVFGPLSGFVLENHIVTADTFGDALPVIVGLAVAIIVVHLRAERETANEIGSVRRRTSFRRMEERTWPH